MSISHSGDYACCAICDESIGVDIEQLCSLERITRVSKRVLAPCEGFTDNPELLLEKWVKKEAYMKLCGLGFELPMTHFSEKDGVYYDSANNALAYCSIIRNQNYFLALAQYGSKSMCIEHVSIDDILALSCIKK